MASVPRYLSRMIIPKLVKQGLGASAIIRDLRKRGLSYRRMSMLSDIRREVGLFKFGKAVKSLPSTVIAPKRIMVETEFLLPRRYRVFGMAKYKHVETGHIKYHVASFYRPTLETKEVWEQQSKEEQPLTRSPPEYIMEEFDIFNIEHNKGYPY